MCSTGALVGCFLLTQLAQAGGVPEEAATVASVEADEAPRDPPQRVAEVLALPEGSAVVGRPLTLLEALAATRGLAERLAAAHAYWRLVRTVGDYRSIFDEVQLIESLRGRPGEDVFLRSARSSALAALNRAEMAAVAAQHDLAEAARFAADDPLPLPADLPHVGPYRTHFGEVFSKQPVPARTRLMDRTLPVVRRAIDLRAAAVEAGEDALEAVVRAHGLGQGDVSTVLACAADWRIERMALVASVCRYNRDIAEYCLAVVGPETDARELVAMLITGAQDVPSPAGAGSSGAGQSLEGGSVAGEGSGVERATMNEPIGDGSRGPTRPLSVREPTLAPPREIPPSVDAEEAAPIPSGKDGDRAAVSVLERPLVPVTPPSSAPIPWTAEKPVPTATGLYPALVGKTPAVQAKQLAAVLHWFRLLPEPAGEPVTLRECLRAVSVADRPEAVRKYWLASQRAAEYQAWVVENNLLEELVPRVTGAGGEEETSVDARRLALARSEAELLDARRELLESQFELAEILGRPLDTSWPVPTTTPHCGPYLLKLDAQPRQVVASWPLRRLAATIPAAAGALERHATAVIEADSTRAVASEAYRSGTRSLDQLLETIRHQTEETLALLDTLGAYNRAIAQYALTVLPPTVSEDQLIGTLVLE